MSLSLSNILLLFAICRILPTSLSRFVGLDQDQDSEGSGYDQGGSGFYSQDGSAGDSDHPKRLMTTTKISDDHNIRIVSQDGGEIRLPRDYDVRPVGFTVEKLKTLLKTKEVIAGIIGGGVMGLVLAVAVAVIYQWKKKDVGKMILKTL